MADEAFTKRLIIKLVIVIIIAEKSIISPQYDRFPAFPKALKIIPTLAAKENCADDTISEVIADVTDIYINYYSGEIDEQTARESEVVSLINYYIANPTAPTIDLTF